MHTPGNRRHAQALASIRDETTRTQVAQVLADADQLARVVPLHEVHDALVALYLVFVGTDDVVNPDRFTPGALRVLVSLAGDELRLIGGRLDMRATGLGHQKPT